MTNGGADAVSGIGAELLAVSASARLHVMAGGRG